MRTFGPYAARVVRVIDGDTLVVDVRLSRRHRSREAHDFGFAVHARPDGLWLEQQHVRLYGCNAPEKTTDAGQVARSWLRELLPAGTDVKLVSHGWDKYGGRIDGEVVYGGHDVAQLAIGAGHAFAWSGQGPKPT